MLIGGALGPLCLWAVPVGNRSFNLVSASFPGIAWLSRRPLMSPCSFAVFHRSQEERAGDRHHRLADHVPAGGRAPRVRPPGVRGRAGGRAAGGDCGPGAGRSNTEIRRGSRYREEPAWNTNLHLVFGLSVHSPLFSAPRKYSLIQYQWVNRGEKKGLYSRLRPLTSLLSFCPAKSVCMKAFGGARYYFLCSLQLLTRSGFLVWDKWLFPAAVCLCWAVVRDVVGLCDVLAALWSLPQILFLIAAAYKNRGAVAVRANLRTKVHSDF